MAEQQAKDGPELAAYRVKLRKRKDRKEREKLKAPTQSDATLIGQLKAAQSNARNVSLREEVGGAVAL